ncbi:MAG: hypothetical protein V2A56_13695 [bacterium]
MRTIRLLIIILTCFILPLVPIVVCAHPNAGPSHMGSDPQNSNAPKQPLTSPNVKAEELVLTGTLPGVISFQGSVTDAEGQPFPDGEYSAAFRLYDSETNGMVLWSELQTVQVENGVLNVLLGSVTPFDGQVDFSIPVWLTVEFDEQDELDPRLPMTSVPYAIQAQRANYTPFADSTTVALKAWTVEGGAAPTGPAGGSLTGSFPNPVIAEEAVTGREVADGSLTGVDISNTTVLIVGSVAAISVHASDSVVAGYFVGDGSGLTNLPQGSLSWFDLAGIPAEIADGDSVNTNWADLTGVPEGFADGVDNVGSSDWNNLKNVPEGFADGKDDTTNSLDWTQIRNHPAGLDDGDDVGARDWSELTGIPEGFTDGVDNTGASDWSELTGIPEGFADGVDNTGASDWSELTGIPADLADGDDVGARDWSDLSGIPEGFADGVDNTGVSDWSELTGIPEGFADGVDNTGASDWSELTGIPADLANGDDVGARDWSELTGIPADLADGDDIGARDWSELSGVPEGFTDGVDNTGASDWSELIGIPADLADGDDVGARDWSELSGVPEGFTDGIDNTGASDWSELTGIPADLAKGEDVGVRDWSELTGIPADLADGDDIGARDWSELSGVPEGFTDGVDNTGASDWSELTGIPADLANGDDVGARDWSELSGIPEGFTDGVDNTGASDWSELTGIPADLADGDSVNTNWADLTGVPEGFADGVDNIGSSDWNDLTNIPTGFSDGKDDTTTSLDWSQIRNRPAGIDDGDDVGAKDWSELTGIPTGFADAVDDTGSGGWSLTGNSGTTPGTNFIGTRDSQPFEIHVNLTRVLRIESGTSSPTILAGRYAQGGDEGSFVWADGVNSAFSGTAPNQFSARATGGFRFVSNDDGTAGVRLNPGSSSWSMLGDRNQTENISAVDLDDLLLKLEELPVTTWNYRSQDAGIRHMSPAAQDFYTAFGLGQDSLHIGSVDAEGVTLAAIQGLIQRNSELEERVAELEALLENEESSDSTGSYNPPRNGRGGLPARVRHLEALVSQLHEEKHNGHNDD